MFKQFNLYMKETEEEKREILRHEEEPVFTEEK